MFFIAGLPIVLFAFLPSLSLQNPQSAVGSSINKCTGNPDCPRNAYCEMNKECFCSNGFVPNMTDEGLKCLQVPEIFGEACKIDLQCKKAFGSHAVCGETGQPGSKKECQCERNAHYTDGLCYPTSKLGEKCHLDENCHLLTEGKGPRAICEGGICVCPSDRHPSLDHTQCLPSAGLDQACSIDGDCVVPSSRCLEVCRCSVGFVESFSKKRCLPAVDNLGWNCEEDRQCTEYLNNAMCHPTTKRCECAPYAHQVHGSCWIKIDLHKECEHPFECVTTSKNQSSVECKAGKCQCTKGHVPVGLDCLPGSSGRPVLDTHAALALVLPVILFSSRINIF